MCKFQRAITTGRFLDIAKKKQSLYKDKFCGTPPEAPHIFETLAHIQGW